MRALTVLSLIWITTSAAAQRSDTSVVHLGVPQSIGEWAFAGRHDYPDPRLGVLVRYQRPDSFRVDVFAYPGPDLATRCPLACAREVLAGDIKEFVSAFPEMIKRQYVDTIYVVSDTTLSPAAGDAWQLGRRLVLGVVSKGSTERSDFYLYYLPGFRIKLRASYVADSARVRGVEEFARLVVPAMLKPMLPSGGSSAEGRRSRSLTTIAARPVVSEAFQRRGLADLGSSGNVAIEGSAVLRSRGDLPVELG